MKTSISSKALSQIGAEKITFPPERGWQKDRRTDICFYRVALLLEIQDHGQEVRHKKYLYKYDVEIKYEKFT